MLDSTMDVILFNPFSSNTISFPPISNLSFDIGGQSGSKRVLFSLKDVLSTNPGLHPDDYIFMVRY